MTHRSQDPARKWRRAHRRIDSRCYRCGFLGAYFAPQGQRSIPIEELSEIPTLNRMWWHGELVRMRQNRQIVDEYNPSMGVEPCRDTSAPFGVACGLGQPQGAGSSWLLGREDLFKGGGMLVEDPHKPFNKHGLGAAVGAVSTDMWALIRPHDCRQFIQHVPGLDPSAHRAIRDAKKKKLLARMADSPLARLIPLAKALGITGVLAWLIRTIADWIR